MYLYFKHSVTFVFQITFIYLILSCIGSISTDLYLKAATLMRKITQVFTENIESLFSLWYQSNKNSNELNQKNKNKKMATPSLPKYLSHLNLANFMFLKLTSTNYLL